jgi:hypothetical protein
VKTATGQITEYFASGKIASFSSEESADGFVRYGCTIVAKSINLNLEISLKY